jgi:biotin transport system substrate-specific component
MIKPVAGWWHKNSPVERRDGKMFVLDHTSLPLLRIGAPYVILKQSVVLALGVGFLALCSWASVPMVPVPMTMQTYAVLLLGLLLGWRMAGLCLLLYLAVAAAGLPVLANGASGIARLTGPTGGFLLSFPLIAMLVGWLAVQGWFQSMIGGFFVLVGAHALILACGGLWLSRFVGFDKALASGVIPFIPGAMIKAGLVVLTIRLLQFVAAQLQRAGN